MQNSFIFEKKLISKIFSHSSRIFSFKSGTPFIPTLAHSLISLTNEHPGLLSKSLIYLPCSSMIPLLQKELLKASKKSSLIFPTFLPFSAPFSYFPSVNEISPSPPDLLSLKGELLSLFFKHSSSDKRFAQKNFSKWLPFFDNFLHLLNLSDLENITASENDLNFPDFALSKSTESFFESFFSAFVHFLKQHYPFSKLQAAKINTALSVLHTQDHSLNFELIIAVPPLFPSPLAIQLLSAIPKFSTGCIVFPSEELSFYQHLLATLEKSNNDVAPWPFVLDKNPKPYLFLNALATFHKKPSLPLEKKICLEALEHLSLIECQTLEEESKTIALLLRSILEEKGKTAALITHDSTLAERVHQELKRWNLYVPCSIPLIKTLSGSFLVLLYEAFATNWPLEKTLALWKHPFCTKNNPLLQCALDALEKYYLRGIPYVSLKHLADQIQKGKHYPRALSRILKKFFTYIEPLECLSNPQNPFSVQKWLFALCSVTENLMSESALLWSGNGYDLFESLWKWCEKSDCYPMFLKEEFLICLRHFLQTQFFKDSENTHPYIKIGSPKDSLFLCADVIILGGLNEGKWPKHTTYPAWISQILKEKFNLNDEEHDKIEDTFAFLTYLSNPKVFLSRALIEKGTPKQSSSFILALNAFLHSKHLALPKEIQWQAWAKQLSDPVSLSHSPRPAPCPPIASRPSKSSVTNLELWRKNPYGFYVKRILKLSPPENLDYAWSPKIFGTFIHKIFEQIVKISPPHTHKTFESLHTTIQDLGKKYFHPETPFFWQFQFERIAQQFCLAESNRRNSNAYTTFSEISGKEKISLSSSSFEIFAKADRIDIFSDGSACIIDYKTGILPSWKMIEQGLSLQLSLEAFLLENGKFISLPNSVFPKALEFWWVHNQDVLKIKRYPKSVPLLISDTLCALKTWLTPFLEHPNSSFTCSNLFPFPELEYFSRFKEWK